MLLGLAPTHSSHTHYPEALGSLECCQVVLVPVCPPDTLQCSECEMGLGVHTQWRWTPIVRVHLELVIDPNSEGGPSYAHCGGCPVTLQPCWVPTLLQEQWPHLPAPCCSHGD